MDLGLQDKRFVVGGASKGLGRAIAEQLAAEGARVLLVSRDETGLKAIADGLGDRAAGYVAADVADTSAVEKISQAIDQNLGGLDGILVNAGGPPGGDVFNLTDEQWLSSYQLLIGGPIRLLRALVPKIEGEGAILFVTSTSVRQPIVGLDTSNVLRPGVAALAKVLARQLAPKIRVNSLMPGRFDTDRIRWLDQDRAKAQGVSVEEQKASASQQIPLGRYGDPVEFGRVGAFLLSPAASYVSGVALQADGALVTAIP
jgi:3-oxoacyl-[acyl-carrier protein] reductase